MIVFGKDNCKYCVSAKELLEELNIPYIYVDIGLDNALKQSLLDYLDSIYRPHTVPQVFSGGFEPCGHIGGYDELYKNMQSLGYF